MLVRWCLQCLLFLLCLLCLWSTNCDIGCTRLVILMAWNPHHVFISCSCLISCLSLVFCCNIFSELRHPNIIAMYGLVQVATKVGIILELGDTNLMNIIQKRVTGGSAAASAFNNVRQLWLNTATTILDAMYFVIKHKSCVSAGWSEAANQVPGGCPQRASIHTFPQRYASGYQAK